MMSRDSEPKPATIYLAAAACPVKDQVYKVAARYAIPLKVVATTWLRVLEIAGLTGDTTGSTMGFGR